MHAKKTQSASAERQFLLFRGKFHPIEGEGFIWPINSSHGKPGDSLQAANCIQKTQLTPLKRLKIDKTCL